MAPALGGANRVARSPRPARAAGRMELRAGPPTRPRLCSCSPRRPQAGREPTSRSAGLRSSASARAAVGSRPDRAAGAASLLHGISAGYPSLAAVPAARPCTLPAHSDGSLSQVLSVAQCAAAELELSCDPCITQPEAAAHSARYHAASRSCRIRGDSRQSSVVAQHATASTGAQRAVGSCAGVFA